MRREVIKHSAAIQIANRITLLERRAWNVMLAHAYDELPQQETHQIGVAELVEYLGISTNNDEHMKGLLRNLAHTRIEWNVLGKDGKNKWGVSALLADVAVQGGKVTYSYSPLMRRQLYNPSLFARVSLSIQNRFGSKYALALYELLVDYLGVGQTGWLSLGEFRRLMGLEEGEYEQFKKLSQRVVSTGINEINRVSDVEASVEYQRTGRTVSHLKFCVRAREKTAAKLVETARTASPAALPARVTHAPVEADPFEAWFGGLTPLEQAALSEEAERMVERTDPAAKGFTRQALVLTRLREIHARSHA